MEGKKNVLLAYQELRFQGMTVPGVTGNDLFFRGFGGKHLEEHCTFSVSRVADPFATRDAMRNTERL